VKNDDDLFGKYAATIKIYVDFKGSQSEVLEKEVIEHMKQRCEELEKSLPEQILNFESNQSNSEV
jgi:hypothetical protein